MERTLFLLCFFILLPIGFIVLQIFLSRQESKWPGLVLPGLSFLFSLCIAVGVYLFMYVPPQDNGLGTVIIPTILLFLMYNIPTLILLAIYFACREKYRKKKQLDKMNIQDLDG